MCFAFYLFQSSKHKTFYCSITCCKAFCVTGINKRTLPQLPIERGSSSAAWECSPARVAACFFTGRNTSHLLTPPQMQQNVILCSSVGSHVGVQLCIVILLRSMWFRFWAVGPVQGCKPVAMDSQGTLHCKN